MSITTEYFRLEGCDRQFFRCERMHATLSVEACATNWRNGNDNDERRAQCRSCPLGAQHAGEPTASISPLKGTLTCSRCHRQSSRAWLIGKRLCVSCWNREREVVRGRNAKGNKPVKLQSLDPRSIYVLEAGTPRTLHQPRTQSHDELVVDALRDCKGSVSFMHNPAAGALMAQLRLF